MAPLCSALLAIHTGAVLNYSSLSGLPPAELAGAAASILRLFDLGGHERFTKTALHGLTTLLPDAMLLCVSAAAGVLGLPVRCVVRCSQRATRPKRSAYPGRVSLGHTPRASCLLPGVSWVTREHLAVALALGMPLGVAITKTDVAGAAGVAAVAGEIRWVGRGLRCALLDSAAARTGAFLASMFHGPAACQSCRDLLAAAMRQGGGTVPSSPAVLAPLVQSAQQAAAMAAAVHRSRVSAPGAALCVPLFAVSSVSGAGLELLHRFLSALQPAGRGSSGKPAAAAGGEGMQGWSRAPGAEAGPEGSKAHFQIDASFEVAGAGTGEQAPERCRLLLGANTSAPGRP